MWKDMSFSGFDIMTGGKSKGGGYVDGLIFESIDM